MSTHLESRRPDLSTVAPRLRGASVCAIRLAAIACFAAHTASVHAAGAPPDRTRVSFAATATDERLRVDGRLDEPAWEHATVVQLPFETWPGENVQAQVETRCLVLLGPRALYLGCTARDPQPSSLRATITDRDQTAGHDRILLMLDPFNDTRRAFVFGVNALGVQSDAVIDPQKYEPDLSWDATWEAAGRPTATGYVVEAAVPYGAMRFPAGGGPRTWGFALTREWPRTHNTELRSMRLDRNDQCVLCQANLLTGVAVGGRASGAVLAPTFTAGLTDRVAEGGDGRLVRDPAARDLGLDLRWSASSALTVSAALNPDFSQVEADAPQLDTNSRFALSYPEKRPFFLDGSDLFSTPLNVVFTRTVSDPAFGAKVIGTSGAGSYAAMVAQDQTPSLLLPGSQSSSTLDLAGPVTTAAGRYRRDIGSSSTLGVLVVARAGRGYSNRVGGVDGLFRPARALAVRAQLVYSATTDPAGMEWPDDAPGEGPLREVTGVGARLNAQYESRRWVGGLDLRSLGRGFRADAGFEPQVDVRGGYLYAGRVFHRGAQRWFSRVYLVGGVEYSEDSDGRLLARSPWANLFGRGRGQTWLQMLVERTDERVGDSVLRLHHVHLGGGGRPTRWFEWEARAVVGDGVDYRSERPARSLRVSPTLTIRAGRHLQFGLNHQTERLEGAGRQVLVGSVTQARVVYNFTTRLFARAVFRLDDTRRAAAPGYLQEVSRSSSVLSQLLLSYKVNPQTVLFIGYGDARDGLAENRLAFPSLPMSSRTLFLKLGYAWRP